MLELFKNNKQPPKLSSKVSLVSQGKEELEYLLSLREDPRWSKLSKILQARLTRKEERLSEKPLYDVKEVATFNALIGEIREIKNILDLDRLIREAITHSDE
jgi:hypothetical protein